jgi:hypothetical protein
MDRPVTNLCFQDSVDDEPEEKSWCKLFRQPNSEEIDAHEHNRLTYCKLSAESASANALVADCVGSEKWDCGARQHKFWYRNKQNFIGRRSVD